MIYNGLERKNTSKRPETALKSKKKKIAKYTKICKIIFWILGLRVMKQFLSLLG